MANYLQSSEKYIPSWLLQSKINYRSIIYIFPFPFQRETCGYRGTVL